LRPEHFVVIVTRTLLALTQLLSAMSVQRVFSLSFALLRVLYFPPPATWGVFSLTRSEWLSLVRARDRTKRIGPAQFHTMTTLTMTTLDQMPRE
jgi:hypothetical protein